jgi:hypothetical protein
VPANQEVAVRTSLVVVAISLILPAGARAEAPRASVPCTRQSLIWHTLFRDASSPPLVCDRTATWLAASIQGASDPLRAEPPSRPLREDVAALRTSIEASSRNDIAGQDPAPAQPVTSPRPTAFEYSNAYNVRRKIHFYASFATIPLFVTQYVLGDKLYDGTSGGSTKSAHSAVAGGMAALFGVNTVTGVWNMWESRKDPNAGKKRFVHGFLMLGADVGFVATGMLAPDDEGGGDNRSTHRNVAITSMAVATASYLIMLIGR